jgi:hypothetical protein
MGGNPGDDGKHRGVTTCICIRQDDDELPLLLKLLLWPAGPQNGPRQGDDDELLLLPLICASAGSVEAMAAVSPMPMERRATFAHGNLVRRMMRPPAPQNCRLQIR